MKRMVLCLIIIAAMLGLAFGAFLYIDKTSSDMSDDIKRIEEAYRKNDSEEIKKSVESLQTCWEEFCNAQIFITDTEHALRITEVIARIEGYAETGSEDILTECSAADRLVESYRSEQVPNILNIL